MQPGLGAKGQLSIAGLKLSAEVVGNIASAPLLAVPVIAWLRLKRASGGED